MSHNRKRDHVRKSEKISPENILIVPEPDIMINGYNLSSFRYIKEKSPNKKIKLSISSNSNQENVEENSNLSFESVQEKSNKSEISNQLSQSENLNILASTTNFKCSTSKNKVYLQHSDQEYANEGVNEQLDEEVPEWAKFENARDKNLVKRGDNGYDPTSLFIPYNELKKMTPAMRQYWQIKADHFDTIVLFKYGKFYETYYEDAIVLHKELDLSWVGKKLNVGFPDRSLDRYAFELVDRGYKLCLVEQIETPRQMEKRVKDEPSGRKEKIIRREPIQILTKGTFVDYNSKKCESRYLLSVVSRKNFVGVTFLEIGSFKITLGAFLDDENHTLLKTLLSQILPNEVIYNRRLIEKSILNILKDVPNQPLINELTNIGFWGESHSTKEISSWLGESSSWPFAIQKTYSMDSETKEIILESFGGLLGYMKSLLIIDIVMQRASFSLYDPHAFFQENMMLDSQALQHLEILNVGYLTNQPQNDQNEGSLLNYIDKTVTKFGKRLIRKWLCAPLLVSSEINNRLDAIEELNSYPELRDKIRTDLKLLPDIS